MSDRSFDAQGAEHWCGPARAPGFYCLGMLYSCGHSWHCYADPAIATHRCAGTDLNVWWALFLTMVAIAAVVALRWPHA